MLIGNLSFSENPTFCPWVLLSLQISVMLDQPFEKFKVEGNIKLNI
jgi:hypothetical protein